MNLLNLRQLTPSRQEQLETLVRLCRDYEGIRLSARWMRTVFICWRIRREGWQAPCVSTRIWICLNAGPSPCPPAGGRGILDSF